MAGLLFVIQQSNTVTRVKDENNFFVLFEALGSRALLIGGAWARPQVALVLGYVVALGSY